MRRDDCIYIAVSTFELDVINVCSKRQPLGIGWLDIQLAASNDFLQDDSGISGGSPERKRQHIALGQLNKAAVGVGDGDGKNTAVASDHADVVIVNLKHGISPPII